MASKHRKRNHSLKRKAAMGVAAATITTLVAGTAPLAQANASATATAAASTRANDRAAIEAVVRLLALATTTSSPGLPSMPLAPGAPDPASIPDLTFGYGGRAYDSFQSLGAALETELLNDVNLSGLLSRFGVDPETEINTALGNALTNLLKGVSIPVAGIPQLGPILNKAGINNAAALLTLLGFDLNDPLDLSGDTLGLNIITTGPPFSLLKFLGIDLGWVPGFPNSVADEINGTKYLPINPVSLLEAIPTENLDIIERGELTTLIGLAKGAKLDADVLDVRVPVVVGFGLGAFAAGMAYPQVVADLANQPGGANNVGADPLAGSITILPMILLRNPGRANGGLFARAYPIAGLFGIDTVTPDTEITNSSDGTGLDIPVGNTGIRLGAANLIPIKVDGTVEYDPLSDFPAWPNPFSLANSGAALFFPTYILRGVTADSLTEVVTNQLNPQLAAALGNKTGPLALNFYLTVPVNGALPLLEPVRLPVDAFNLFTGANLNNPVATALEPALTTLVNLGYTDVKRTVDANGVPVYDRTLDQANVITPFGSLPQNVDWGQVPGDLVLQLAAGLQKAAGQGLVGSTPVANPLAALARLLGIDGLPGAASATSGVNGLTALSALPQAATSAAAGSVVPTPAPPSGSTPGGANLAADRDVALTPPAQTRRAAAVVPTGADASLPAGGAGSATAGAPKPSTVKDPFTTATTNAEAAAKRAQARTDAAFKKASENLNKIAKDGQDQIRKIVNGVHDTVQKPANQATGAGKSPAGSGSPGGDAGKSKDGSDKSGNGAGKSGD